MRHDPVDFNMPERFGAFYISASSEKTTPIMIHRAILGSVERFIANLLEHHAGHLPLWLAPVQIVVCTITSDADDARASLRRRSEEAGPAGSKPTSATRRSITRCVSIR